MSPQRPAQKCLNQRIMRMQEWLVHPTAATPVRMVSRLGWLFSRRLTATPIKPPFVDSFKNEARLFREDLFIICLFPLSKEMTGFESASIPEFR